MRIIKLAWVGTRTDNAEPTVAFFREVLDLPLELNDPGFWMLLESEVDDSGNAWVHFQAPDGNIYEFTQDPGVSRPH
jgi:hypothetical protein